MASNYRCGLERCDCFLGAQATSSAQDTLVSGGMGRSGLVACHCSQTQRASSFYVDTVVFLPRYHKRSIFKYIEMRSVSVDTDCSNRLCHSNQLYESANATSSNLTHVICRNGNGLSARPSISTPHALSTSPLPALRRGVTNVSVCRRASAPTSNLM